MRLQYLPALAPLALAQIASAQCGVNDYPIILVDAQGVPAPVTTYTPLGGSPQPLAVFATEQVYMSFANLPDGLYSLYVHTTDHLNANPTLIPPHIDEVLSTNDPADRFVTVAKAGGVVNLTLPLTNNLDPNVIVALPNGNEILAVTPVKNASGPDEPPCIYKTSFGDTFDLSLGAGWPYIVRTSIPDLANPGSFLRCSLGSYTYFRIGDSVPGSDVSGSAFGDVDRDGVRDGSESPLVNWEVRLVTSTTTQSIFTDGNGNYTFPNVTEGAYTVELVLPAGYDATTTSAHAIQVCGCADQDIREFGAAVTVTNCDGRTIGFWRNKNGTQIVQRNNILATLGPLCLANANGTMVTPPTTIAQWGAWLQGANAVNMAYMLSAQLAAMHCNIAAGNVDSRCVISDPVLGNMTIADLVQQATNALCNDGYTPEGDSNRPAQTNLKNALDSANNNQNWF